MDYKRVELLQNIWDVITNIIGHSLIAAVIILGVQNGYHGTTHFTVFCWAAAVYFFSKYIFRPKSKLWVHRIKEHTRATFQSVIGTGEVLYGHFGDLVGGRGAISYCFLSICYIPLIPIGCYGFSGTGRKMIQFTGEKITGNGSYSTFTLAWNWKEILQIYLKNWSFAVMAITMLDVIIPLLLNPYMNCTSLQ